MKASASAQPPASLKPYLRGHFHQAAFFTALGACAMLIAGAQNMVQQWSALVYSIGLCGLLGVSALYHRPHWSAAKRKIMRRLDHCMIFWLIGGTFTPVCLLAMTPETGVPLLKLTICVTIAGMIQSLFWVTAPKWLAALIYVSFGLLIMPYLPELQNALPVSSVACLIAGGAAYVIGAVIYAIKRPNPWPRVFGYHEVFHLLVVVAAIFHFVIVARLIG